jgi:hypothetical protein
MFREHCVLCDLGESHPSILITRIYLMCVKTCRVAASKRKRGLLTELLSLTET